MVPFDRVGGQKVQMGRFGEVAGGRTGMQVVVSGFSTVVFGAFQDGRLGRWKGRGRTGEWASVTTQTRYRGEKIPEESIFNPVTLQECWKLPVKCRKAAKW